MSQISLPFEGHEGQGEGDFLVSEANRIAVAFLEGWRAWPLSVAVLIGPPRSGRSTLARQFARMSGGTVIDDAQGTATPVEDHRLFHAWNAAQTDHRPLLLVGQAPPAISKSCTKRRYSKMLRRGYFKKKKIIRKSKEREKENASSR